MTTTVPSDESVEEQRLLASMLLDHLHIDSCHVSGMHDPTHTTRRFCQIQKAEAFDRLLAAAGINIEDLPRRLTGYARKDKASVERMTEQQKREQAALLAWENGAPMALFTDGSDVEQKGDRDILLSVLTTEYQTWQTVLPLIDQVPPEARAKWTTERYWNVVRSAKADGVIEQRDISVRLAAKPAAEEDGDA